MYYKGADVALFVYAIDSAYSYNRINDYWEDQLNENCNNVQIQKVIVGNKCDKESSRTVDGDEAFDKAKKNGFQFYETSIYKEHTINSMFQDIAEALAKKPENLQSVRSAAAGRQSLVP